MIRYGYLLVLASGFILPHPVFGQGPMDPNPPPDGFEALFNDRDLAGWRGYIGGPPKQAGMSAQELTVAQRQADDHMRAHWRITNDVLHFDGQGSSIVTDRPFGDFELRLDWKIAPGGDSGVYLRGSPQVQIWDNPIGSGGLYNNQTNPSEPMLVADRPPGEWNTFRIVMIGERVSVWLNDIMVVADTPLENYWERDKPVYATGPIELQAHGNPLWFRNIFVRKITNAEQERDLLRDTRLDWWREAKFGLFIHWGLYAIPAGRWNGKKIGGTGEWLMHNARIPVADYERLAGQFNPVNFDADQWVQIAKSAGMKYIVITSKHHDGFGLFDSAMGEYDIIDATPFGRDIMKELSDACRREGIKICWYHSILDWHHPDAKGERFDDYVPYLNGQVRDLLTNYGDIGVLWFDGEWIKEWNADLGRELYAMCRQLQPGVIVNNRVGKGRQGMSNSRTSAGDFGTPEQEIPATGIPGYDWETCMTMNDTWGFKIDDQNWKSPEQLIRMLINIVSKGGNFLLNVGPTALGEIPPPSVERLKAIGDWMRVNRESIYGAGPSVFGDLQWGRCTTKPGKLYLHVFDWPSDGKLHVPGLKNQVTSAHILGWAKNVAVNRSHSGDDWIVHVPRDAPDPIATVIVLQIEGEPMVQASSGSVQENENAGQR